MFASFLRLSTTEQQSGSIISSMPAFPKGARGRNSSQKPVSIVSHLDIKIIDE
jgi:hypothetical protein